MASCKRSSLGVPENFEGMSQCVGSGGHLNFGMCIVTHMEVGESA